MRLDAEIVEKGKKIAKQQKESFTQWVTDVLWGYIKNLEKESRK